MTTELLSSFPANSEFKDLVLVDEFYQQFFELEVIASQLNNLDERINEIIFDTGETNPPTNEDFDIDIIETEFDDLTLEELCELYTSQPFPEEGSGLVDLLESTASTLNMTMLIDSSTKLTTIENLVNSPFWRLLLLLLAIAKRVGGASGKLLVRLINGIIFGKPIKNILQARKTLQAARGLTNVPNWSKQIFIRFAERNYRQVLKESLTTILKDLAVIGLLELLANKFRKELEKRKENSEQFLDKTKRQLENSKNDLERSQLKELLERENKVLKLIDEELNKIKNNIEKLNKEKNEKQAKREQLNKELQQLKSDEER